MANPKGGRKPGSLNRKRGTEAGPVQADVPAEIPGIELSPRARDLVRRVMLAWSLDDVSRDQLRLAAEAMSVSEKLHAICEAEGWVQVDRFGARKPHCCAALEASNRATSATILARLRVDLE